MGQVSRRALLARAGIGTGAGVVTLFAGAAPALGAPSAPDLANVRLVCAGKRVAITWLTRWINTPKALDSSGTQDLVRAIRSQEQTHYGVLAPLLSGTAPTDDDYTYNLPAGALRSFERASVFALSLEETLLGIAIGAAATTADVAVAELLATVVAGDGQHFAALSALGGGPEVPNGMPRAIGIEDAGNQLNQFLSY
jgi:hypothetical protein